MNEHESTYNEIDDHIAQLTEAEREELATADAAIELAFLFHDAREARGLTQAEAAQRAGLRQQAVSRFEQPDMKLANTKIETLRKYLAALGYGIQITLKDLQTGIVAANVDLPPQPRQTSVSMIVPWVKWFRGPTTAKTAIKAWEFNPPNVQVSYTSRGTHITHLLPGGANTRISREPRELIETYA